MAPDPEGKPGRRELLLARAYLSRVAEPPSPALSELIEEVGPCRAADLVAEGKVSAAVATATAARREINAVDDLERASRSGCRLLVPEDDGWPHWRFGGFLAARGAGIDNAVAPIALWQRGTLDLADATDSAIAVVGSRAATGYGDHVAGELGYDLARHGYTVVSGAAMGIDGAAHRGALGAGGRTIAVLGCGIDVDYPAGHTGLLKEIGVSGAVISEYPFGVRPARHRFLVRNRLVAAMTDGTVVVEAGRRSGARNTASLAAALGRVVMAVPGPVTSAMSAGTNQLLRDEVAVTVCGADDVIASAGRIGDGLATPDRVTTGRDEQPSGVAARVLDAVDFRTFRSLDEVSTDAGVPGAHTDAVLRELKVFGLVREVGERWCRVDVR